MENAPVIRLAAWKFYKPEEHERFGKWNQEAYIPLLMKDPAGLKIDRFKIVRETSHYANFISIYYFGNVEDAKNNFHFGLTKEGQKGHPEYTAYANDLLATWVNKRDVLWEVCYERIESLSKQGWKSDESGGKTSKDARPILHIEGLSLPPGEEKNYDSWFSEWARGAFIPILIKLPGLIQYDCYARPFSYLPEREEYVPFMAKRPDYPQYVSLLWFEDIEHYEAYEKSEELAAFRRLTMRDLPNLNFKWYVQYQLIGSWRK